MDQMDIDDIVDVPDTPDRLATRISNDRSRMREENLNSSISCHSGQQTFCEGSRHQPMLIDSGSKSPSLRPLKFPSSTQNYLHHDRSASVCPSSSSSPISSIMFRKGVIEKSPNFQTERASISSRPSASHGDSFVDLTKRNLRGPLFGKSSSDGVIGSSQPEFRKRSGIFHGSSSSHGLRKIPAVPGRAAPGVDGVSPNADNGEGIEINGSIQNKDVNRDVIPLDTIVSSRANKQKRLVRNGCISPNNIAAKAKQSAGKNIKSSAAVLLNNNVSLSSSSPTMPIDIMELVAEDSNNTTLKGKGVLSHPCLTKELECNQKNLHNRNSSSSNEKAKEVTNNFANVGKNVEKSGGWRSTHNQTGKISSPSHEKLMIRETSGPKFSNLQHDNMSAGKGKVENDDGHPRELNFVASENVHSQPLRQPMQHARGRLGRLDGNSSLANTLLKRQKQRSTPSNFSECSKSLSDDPELVFLSPSSDPGNITSTSRVNIAQPIIEVDDFSNDSRCNSLDEDARAIQLEADELLARQLQEQLYNEMPVLGAEEIDAHIALTLQRQDETDHRLSRVMHSERDTRGSLVSNLRRQSQPRSSNVPRRGSLGRTSTLGRMTRLRNPFPGRPRTLLPSRGSTSLFPSNMDVEMRMHILGAMEAFSDMGVDADILHTQRDFNENDYEMLLALDENNDRRGGASVHQINGLPQSTVQSDNYEACAICLETPAIGDTIRHLPCLHKFHKDCIDPWLRRKTSCPVCKSSIT